MSKVSLSTLSNSLLFDLQLLGLPTDFKLSVKEYSASYNGRYSPKNTEVILYAYQDKECTKEVPYAFLLETAIHEVCHHIQWKDPNFKRYKGIMHNNEFKELFNKYTQDAKFWGLIVYEKIKTEKALRGKVN
jgi:hypothetical protein